MIIFACAMVLGLLGALASEDAAFVLGGIGYLVAVVLYAPIMLPSSNGQTWGKQSTGVRVINADGAAIGFGRAFVREVLLKAIVFGVIPFIGLLNVLWPLWQDEHKALHDFVAGTRVVDG